MSYAYAINTAQLLWDRVVLGEPVSKSNSRRNAVLFGRVRRRASIKSQKALKYCEDFIRQVGVRSQPLTINDVTLTCRVFYASRRPDLDLELVCDLLQKAGIIKNDRQIKEKHYYHGIDHYNPRVEIQLWSRL